MEGLDLHLGVDKAAGFVGRALEAALREAIRSGRLRPRARLPGSRSLALLPVDSAERERALIARGRRAGVDLHGLHAHGYWRDPGGDQAGRADPRVRRSPAARVVAGAGDAG